MGAMFFFCSYFARVSPSVMADVLMFDLNVTAAAIGSLSAFFLYPYVAMQVPAGLLVDRFGAKRILLIMMGLVCVGCVIFGLSNEIAPIKFGRFCIGFGSAFAFVGTLKLASGWFDQSRLGLLVGMTQAMGMLGAALGGYPVAKLTQAFGWHTTLYIFAGMFALLALVIFVFAKERKKPDETLNVDTTSQMRHIWDGFKFVLENPQSWWNAAFAGFLYAPIAAFAELWGVSFLEHARGFTHTSAATANSLIFVGWGVGGPLIGMLSDKIRKRIPFMYFSAISGLILISLLLYVDLPDPVIYILLFLFGLTNTGVAISYTLATEINPSHVAGTSFAFANMASVIVGMGLQPLIGTILDVVASTDASGVILYSSADYQTALCVLPICSILGIRETHCKPIACP